MTAQHYLSSDSHHLRAASTLHIQDKGRVGEGLTVQFATDVCGPVLLQAVANNLICTAHVSLTVK